MQRFGILGAGAMGSYYAALLSRAGREVHLLARGAHLEALRSKGLAVTLPSGTIHTTPNVIGTWTEAPRVDFALLTVKSYSLDEIAPAAASAARDGAMILPLLNGVDIRDRLVALGVPAEQILGGVATISVARTSPGVVERRSPFDRVIAGAWRVEGSSLADLVVDELRDAGVDARASSEIALEQWRKFSFIVPMGIACGLTRRPMGATASTESGRALLAQAVAEVCAVARASGVPFTADDEQNTLTNLLSLPAAAKPSFLLDLERGGPTELDVLAGAVSRLGHDLGVPVPLADLATTVFSIATSPA
jgi:2-dehydropantoate 2-reductase